ncbi:MAG: uracil-DNA glycosylase [Clostridia bacterium]|nr:uracil-DNA glycosylase [Clostridia bacterium]
MADITWDLLETQVQRCQLCSLYKGIHHKVPGQGDRSAPLMLIGEGPGREEDEQGLAFVGAAGQLLTRMLSAISLPRERVYICNVVKCRPPQNRTPLPEEMEACRIHLRMQTWLLRPQVILLLGATAAKAALGPDTYITRVRGKWIEKNGVWMLPTFHPSALLRDESKKPLAWEDMKSLRQKLQELHLYEDIYG